VEHRRTNASGHPSITAFVYSILRIGRADARPAM
jgi:hypothetical protein